MKQPYHAKFDIELLHHEFRNLHANTDFNNPRQSELFTNFAKALSHLGSYSMNLLFYKLDEDKHPTFVDTYFVALTDDRDYFTVLSNSGLIMTFPYEDFYLPYPEGMAPHRTMSFEPDAHVRRALAAVHIRLEPVDSILADVISEIEYALMSNKPTDVKEHYLKNAQRYARDAQRLLNEIKQVKE